MEEEIVIMGNRVFLHGTSYDNAVSIIRGGFEYPHRTVWECSNRSMLYVRDASDDDALFECLSNAKITAAYFGQVNTQLAVVRIEMSEELAEDVVYPDDSCENMYNSYELYLSDITEGIRNGSMRVEVNFFSDSYVPYLRVFYLSTISSNLMRISDTVLREAVNAVRGVEGLDDVLFEYGSIVDTFDLGRRMGSVCQEVEDTQSVG